MPAAPPTSTHDPFSAFDRACGVGVVYDMHAPLATARAAAAVQETTLAQIVGAPPVADTEDLIGTGPRFVALTFDTVTAVLRDASTWSSAAYADFLEPVAGRALILMDAPEHRRYRNLVQQAFTPAAITSRRDRIEDVVHRHLDPVAAAGAADLQAEFAFQYPIAVIAAMLGLPERDLPDFHRWAIELITVIADPETGMRASRVLRDYFAGIVAERRRKPADDLTTALVQAELDGERLGDEEIFAFLRLLLPAGAETTYRGTSNLLFALLTHPDQLDAVRDDRSLIPGAIEETLRWESSVTQIARTATRDTEVGGVPIPAGGRVSAVLISANRDESRWEQPDKYDVRRPAQTTASFATGPHMCLGLHLARFEMGIALEAVLDRLPGLHLDPDAGPRRMSGLLVRAPEGVPVRFDRTT